MALVEAENMTTKRLAITLAGLIALTPTALPLQGSAQILDPDDPVLPDPLEGNHTCATAFVMVPGVYEGLSVTASLPDFFVLQVPAGGSLHVQLTVREQKNDFTVDTVGACGQASTFIGSGLRGTHAFTFDNEDTEPEEFILRFYRELSNYAPIQGSVEFDVVVSENGELPYADFCTSENSVMSCPCANSGSTRGGCQHSGGESGRLILGGSQYPVLGGMSVHATNLPAGVPAMLFSSGISGEAMAVPFHDGLFCHGNGNVIRHGARFADETGFCDWTGDYSSTEGRIAGESVLLQVWFRDTNGPCGTGSNFTQATKLRVRP